MVSVKQIDPVVREVWRFQTFIEFHDGHREHCPYGLYEDEYGKDVGSYTEDVGTLSKKLNKNPVAGVIEFWLERTLTYQYHDQFETRHVVTQKLFKQEQRTKLWWCGVTHEGLRLFLDEPGHVVNNAITVDFFTQWHGTHKAFSAYYNSKHKNNR